KRRRNFRTEAPRRWGFLGGYLWPSLFPAVLRRPDPTRNVARQTRCADCSPLTPLVFSKAATLAAQTRTRLVRRTGARSRRHDKYAGSRLAARQLRRPRSRRRARNRGVGRRVAARSLP